jgi:heme/copper-type cytochrome/quinol oxidase subunit 3
MAKKKKHKKHNFNHAKSAPQATNKPAEPTAIAATPTRARAVASGPQLAALAMPDKHMQQITADVRRVLMLAVGFVLLQIILWYLFEHTGLGPAVYNLVHH